MLTSLRYLIAIGALVLSLMNPGCSTAQTTDHQTPQLEPAVSKPSAAEPDRSASPTDKERLDKLEKNVADLRNELVSVKPISDSYSNMANAIYYITALIGLLTLIAAIAGFISWYRIENKIRTFEKERRESDDELTNWKGEIDRKFREEINNVIEERSNKLKDHAIKHVKERVEEHFSDLNARKTAYYHQRLVNHFGMVMQIYAEYVKNVSKSEPFTLSERREGAAPGSEISEPLALLNELHRLLSQDMSERIEALNIINRDWVTKKAAFPETMIPPLLRHLRDSGYIIGTPMHTVAEEICRKCGDDYWKTKSSEMPGAVAER